MDNIKRVVKDVRFLIARDCCDETIQSRIENFINEREQALRIHDVSGRSEQFISLIKELINVGIIDEDDIEVETWVKNYLKEINCH